jgi:membrane-associated phospholipid phosphatase
LRFFILGIKTLVAEKLILLWRECVKRKTFSCRLNRHTINSHKEPPLKLSFLNTILLVILFLAPINAFPSEISAVTFSGEIAAGAHRLGNEAVDLAVTPFQLENGNIFITLGVAGAVGLTYTFDREIQDKLTAHPNRSLNKAADAGALIGDPYLHLGLATLVYGGAILADSAKWKETGEMMGEALILTDAAAFIIKEASGRGRPLATQAKGDFKPFSFKKDYDSMPSMHTSSSFALASVLAASADSIYMKAAYYGAATFVGLSRAYQNKHWASDVILGAAIGELCGRVVTNYHAGNSRVALAPTTYEGGAGLALVGTW